MQKHHKKRPDITGWVNLLFIVLFRAYDSIPEIVLDSEKGFMFRHKMPKVQSREMRINGGLKLDCALSNCYLMYIIYGNALERLKKKMWSVSIKVEYRMERLLLLRTMKMRSICPAN